MFSSVPTGFELSQEDQALVNRNRAITMTVNDRFIQVGAVWLKMSGKMPTSEDWAEKRQHDTRLQDWIDDPNQKLANVGFNLQMGWTDIDIDCPDPNYNRALIAALKYNGVDTRFRFGRRSFGVATHILVQLGEEEASNFESLSRFNPREFRIDGQRFHTEIRSYPTNITDKKNLYRSAKQVVMPGSVYLHKTEANAYDVSVWYHDGGVAENVSQIATTTPRRSSYNQIVRSIAFATFVYVLQGHWVEGQRQNTANKVCGWLARVVADGEAINNHEVISEDVFCPVDTDDIAESLLAFACDYFNDEESHMRIRSYRDAREKLAQNPDAKIPGWPAIEAMIGPQQVNALRTTFTPGSDVSILTQMAERYLYDDTDGLYIDRVRHRQNHQTFTHEPNLLERRHIDETVIINGKPRAAFKMFETSKMRIRVAGRDLYPDMEPGTIFRVDTRGDVVQDDDDSSEGQGDAGTIFNTWRGWPYSIPAAVDQELLDDLVRRLDQLLAYLTCDNLEQATWVKEWLAWTFQHPADKQQIAWVCVGGQGVGKSFFGNILLPAIFGPLWGSASASIIDNKFNVGPFIGKMMTFVDEVKFHNEAGTDEVKKLIRNVDVAGMEKFGEGRNYKIYSRLMFASNRFDMSIGQSSVLDRALFYTKAYDYKHVGMTDSEFRAWADTLKPWFTDFANLLKRVDVREHLFYYFMTLPTDKYRVESIKHSSSADEEIATANMRPSRRVAKYIIEEGRIHEDLNIEYRFTMADLGRKIDEVSSTLHIRPVRTDLVLAEWTDAGLVRRMGMHYVFNHKLGTLIEKFGAFISVPLEVRYTLTESDYGDNEDPTKRTPLRGGKANSVVQNGIGSKV